MKKVLIIVGIIIALLIILLFVGPIIFKPQIVKLVKDQAGEQMNASLDFEDVGISLFKNFPKLTATVEKLTVINKAPFEGDTLVYLHEFQATLDLMSLIGGNIEILSIQLIEPRINLVMLPDSSANWDIVPPDTAAVPAEKEEATAFSMAIQQYEISNASITYTDQLNDMQADVKGLTHVGQGDFNQAMFTLTTNTLITGVTVKMAGVPYLNEAEIDIKANIEMDMENLKYTFKENEIRLNQLFLNFDGWVATPNENDIEMDINFAAKKAEFKNILSMVPMIYMKDFGELEADGQLALRGNIKGKFNEQVFPSFDINLGVQNGRFQYPELPTPVENVSVSLNIKNPKNNLDDTIVDLKKFHLTILNEPIDFKLMVKTPISDPYIDANFTGKVNLAEAKNVMPLEQEMELNGTINTNFRFQGHMSDIEARRTNKLTATGSIVISDVKYSAADLPVPVEVQTVDLTITPANASLNKCKVKLGDSDISARGGLDNIVGFVLSDQTLKGTLNVDSKYLDLSPFMVEDSSAMAEAEADTLTLAAIEIPDKIEFVMIADFKKVKLDSLVMTDTKGKIEIKNQIARMINVRSNLVGGSMVSNGTYKYVSPAPPKIDFDLKIDKFSIAEMYATFVTVQHMAPLSKYIKGTIGGSADISSDLGDSLMPVLETLNSRGNLKIDNAKIEGLEGLNKVAEQLKIKELRDPGLTSLHPSYVVRDGRLFVDPMTFKVGGYNATASGSNAITYDMNGDLDYTVVVDVPSDQLVGFADNMNYVKDLNLKERLKGKITKVPIKVRGTSKKPSFSLDMNAVTKTITDQVGEILKEEAEKKKNEVIDKAKDEVGKKLEDGLKKLFGN